METKTETPPETPEKKSKFLDPKANAKGLVRIVAIVFVLLAGVWLLIRFTAGEKAANRVTAEVLQRPIELKNGTETLPAASFRWDGLSLPYNGTLTIEVTVPKGNDLDIALVSESEIENVKAKKQFRHFSEFESNKTKNYRRSGRLKSGNYYLVFWDKSLGILSASSTDIKINARLEP